MHNRAAIANKFLQGLLLLLLQWNAVNTLTNGPNKIGRINEGFFTRICMAVLNFARRPNQVAVMTRWP